MPESRLGLAGVRRRADDPRREADDPRREDDGVRRCSLDATEERSSSSLGGRARSARGGRSRRLDRGRCVERGRSEETVRDDKPKSTSLPPPPSSAMSAGTALRDGLGAERRSSVRAFICFDTRAGLFDSSDSAAARLARPRSRICAVSSALRTLLTRSRSRLFAICSVVSSILSSSGVLVAGETGSSRPATFCFGRDSRSTFLAILPDNAVPLGPDECSERVVVVSSRGSRSGERDLVAFSSDASSRPAS